MDSGMLRQDPAKKIVFDMNEWLKLDGESGPFIQYSFARINSLVSKLSQEVFGYSVDLKKYDKNDFIKLTQLLSTLKISSASDSLADWNQLKEKAEIELAQFLMYYHHQLMLSVENYKPSTMCTYVYDLAKRFNFFYHECPIGNEPNLELKKARLALAMCTGLVLEKGLEILGIPVPKRM